MPRTKGSRNRTAALSIDERIAAAAAEIEALQERIKEKKEELKRLKAEKAEEDKQRIMGAVAASGKSTEEILALINGAVGINGDEQADNPAIAG